MKEFKMTTFMGTKYVITVREIIASVIVFITMMAFGAVISVNINEHVVANNLKYEQAARISSDSAFAHGLDASIGNAFCEGVITSVGSVTYDDLDAGYMRVERVEEHYNVHTRPVTTTINGKLHTTTQTYHSWDRFDSEEKHVNSIEFLGKEFKYDLFANKLDCNYLDTVKVSNKVRYKYYGTPIAVKCTIFGNLINGTINNGINVYEDKTIEDAFKIATSSIKVGFFWTVWILLVLSAIFAFYYLENKWLNN